MTSTERLNIAEEIIRRARVTWVVIDGRDQTLKCLRCNGQYKLPLPMPISQVVVVGEGFGKMHQFCKEIGQNET